MRKETNNNNGKRRFMDELEKKIEAFSHMQPGTTHVFNVHAKYGNYQIIISAAPSKEISDHSSVEIKGEIHHLFLSDHGMQTTPTREQISHNLKGMLILQGLKVDFKNPNGDGRDLHAEHVEDVKPQEIINMAGNGGDEIYKHAMEDGTIRHATYEIIQKDILHALDKHEIKEETFEESE
ncbi:MAG: hypothetical protein ABIE74_06180 [Pseudomonadota bacterium]